MDAPIACAAAAATKTKPPHLRPEEGEYHSLRQTHIGAEEKVAYSDNAEIPSTLLGLVQSIQPDLTLFAVEWQKEP